MKDETYYFHQTPKELCVELLKHVDIEENDLVWEPFKGEGGFYDSFPSNCRKIYTEIEEDKCYTSQRDKVDWIVSNPPFKIDINGKNKCAFYYLTDYMLDYAEKGLAFLANDYCFSAFTPTRMKKINERGFYIDKVVVCSVKKWRGRYYFIVFKKKSNDFFKYVEGNF
jgi:hypothetical protein